MSKRFEYERFSWGFSKRDSHDNEAALIKELDTLGSAGWQIVYAQKEPNPDYNGFHFECIMMREVE